MKKITSIISILFVCLATILPVFAEFANPSIVDNAEYLDESQLAELSEKLDMLRETYNVDVAVYTEKEMSGIDAQNCADDIFDYNGYGGGDGADGMILYICANPRKYHFSTHGKGEEIFNDSALEYLENRILLSLKEDDYYTALKLYAETSEELLKMSSEGITFGEEQLSTGDIAIVIIGEAIISILIAFVMMGIKLRKMKTARQNNYAADYVKQNSMNISDSRDIFLYSSMTRTPKPKAESNTGGHISSSGQHHGGRGGSF